MKAKHLLYRAFFLLSLVFTACTLSMEDWVPTEEEEGYDEPVTVSDQFMTMSYKYKPTTRSLTASIMQYVQLIEDDTVLYFSNSLPRKWLPVVGGCVVCNCCDEYPTGLMGKVLSVEDMGGLTKVTTTYTTLNEVFDEFDYEFDSYLIYKEVDQNDSASTRAAAAVKQRHRAKIPRRGKVAGEGTDIDWSMYDLSMSGGSKAKISSRAPRKKDEKNDGPNIDIDRSDEEYKEEDEKYYNIPGGYTTIKEIHHFTLDGNSPIGKQFVEWLKKGFFKDKDVIFRMAFSEVQETKVVKKIKVKTGSEETETTISSGVKVEGTFGRNFDDKIKGATHILQYGGIDPKTGKYSFNTIGKSSLADFFEKINKTSFGFVIPFGRAPFGFCVRIKPDISVDISLVGSGTAVQWIEKTCQKTKVVNGKVKEDSTKKLKVPNAEVSLSMMGKLNAHVAGEIVAGLGTMTAGSNKLDLGLVQVGFNADYVGVGAYLQLGLDAGFQIGVDGIVGNSESAGYSKVYVTGFREYGGIAMGGWLGDIHFASHKETKTFLEMHYHPTIETQTPYVYPDVDPDTGEEVEYLTGTYRIKDLGFGIVRFHAGDYKPRLRIYRKNNDGEFIYMKTIDDVKKTVGVQGDMTYSYKLKLEDKGVDYQVQPLLYDVEDDWNLTYDTKVTVREQVVPKIKLYLQDMVDYNDFVYMTKVEKADDNRKKYTLSMPLYVKNIRGRHWLWKDYGIDVTVKVLTDQLLDDPDVKPKTISKSFVDNLPILEDGYYVPRIVIKSSEKHLLVKVDPWFISRFSSGKKDYFFNSRVGREFFFEPYRTYKDYGSDIKVNNNIPIDKETEDIGTYTYDWTKLFKKESAINYDIRF